MLPSGNDAATVLAENFVFNMYKGSFSLSRIKRINKSNKKI